MKPSLCAVLLLLLIGRGGATPTAAPEPVDFDGHPQLITQWLSLGPWLESSDQAAVARDFLGSDHSPGETAATFAALARTIDSFSGNPLAPAPRILSKQADIFFYNLYPINKPAPAEPAPSFYLCARIVTATPQRAHLLLGSDGITKLWLNGVPVGNPIPRRTELAQPLSTVVTLSLAAGENLLLVKIAAVRLGNGLTAKLVGEADAAVAEAVEYNGSILRSLLLQPGAAAQVILRGGPPRFDLPVEIRNAAGMPVANTTIGENPSALTATTGLPPGLYTIGYRTLLGAHQESFAIGEIDSLAQQTLAALRKAAKTSADQNNADTLARRVDLLFAPENRKPADPTWQEKILYEIKEANDALRRLSAGGSAWAGVPGLHLRSVVSDLDGQVRHYRLFVPSSYDRSRPLALAIIQPTTLSAFRPFIESRFVADHAQAERMGRIAERLNIGILWPGYPAQPYGNPAEYTYLDNVLRQVGEDYTLDRSRLYLLGTCRAGMTATMMAEHWPRRFAALAVLNTLTERAYNRARFEPNFRTYAAYNQWLGDMAPLRQFARIRGLPIQAVFDGGDPDHGTLEDAGVFVDSAKAAQVAVDFQEVPHSNGHFLAWEEMLRWAAQQRAPAASDEPAPAVAKWRESGTVACALAGGFVLVVGTQGNSEEIDVMRRIATAFDKRWRESYSGPCRVIRDDEVTTELMAKYTLVLIGNARTNLIWAEFRDSIPVKLAADSITAYGHVYPGSRLSIQAAVPHPAMPGRQLVLIGSEQLTEGTGGKIEPSIDGWFDYAIWQGGRFSPDTKLIAAERRPVAGATQLQLAATANQ